MRKSNHLLQVAAAVLAVALLAQFLREWWVSRSGSAGSGLPDGRHQQTREVRIVEGEEPRDQERPDGITEQGDELRVSRAEEEVAVSKRPVVKEVIRIRKHVVEDTKVVEVDVRREEVDVVDETTRRDT